MMTFEQKHIEEASVVLSRACETISSFRNKRNKSTGLVDSLGKLIKKADYNQYTDNEVHAELCYAEVLLLKAVLTLCNETLVSFVKAGLTVRACYQSYRECYLILQERRTWSNQDHRRDFESGVRFGVGCFNLMISLLPARVMKLLEFIGFGGNKVTDLFVLNLHLANYIQFLHYSPLLEIKGRKGIIILRSRSL